LSVWACCVDAVFSPDGTRFVTTGWPGYEDPAVRDAASGEVLRTMDTERGDGPLFSLAYSPDGTQIAGSTSNENPGLVFVWNERSGARVQTLGEDEEATRFDTIRGLAFHPDGTLLAGITASGQAHLWNVTSGEKVNSFLAQPATNGDSIAFSADGSVLATTGADGAALWSMPSGRLMRRLTGHGGVVNDVAFSPDGSWVATAGQDDTARIWSVATGREIHTLFGHTGGVTGVAFSPDGTILVTSGNDGTVREYTLVIDELLEIARSRLTRTLSPAECRQYLHVSSCPASVRMAPSPSVTPSATTGGPEGAFRTAIVPSDLKGPFSERSIGDFTLSMFDGTWRLHHDKPNGKTWDTSGTYIVSGDRILFTDRQDPGSFGLKVSARWSLIRGATLSLTDVETVAISPGDRAFFKAVSEGIFESHGWTRIV
jgi:WD40 repeat protein